MIDMREVIMFAIEAKRLVKEYNGFKALNELSLFVPLGTLFGLLGPNGAGKTTTMRILSTLLDPTSGEIKIMGFDLRKDTRRIREMIGFAPETPLLYDRLTALENLKLFANYYHIPLRESDKKIEELLHKVGMWEWRNELVKNFSKGMKQRINIVRALLNDPKVLFLDEPTSGLDPQTNRTIRKLLKALVSGGTTVVVTSHMMHEVEQLCDEVAIIDEGRVIVSGKPKELKERYSNLKVDNLEDLFIELTGYNMRDKPKRKKWIFKGRKK